MKKIKYLALSVICLIIMNIYAVHIHADSFKIIEEGVISLSVRFDNMEKLSDVTQRDIALTLYQNDKVMGSVYLNQDNDSIGNYSLNLVENLFDYGDDIYISSYYVEVLGLQYGEYTLKVSGDKHKTFISDTLEVIDYSKHVEIGSGDASFTYGDLNNDGVVNELDGNSMTNAVLEDDLKYDLSNDGILDILDLVMFEKNISASNDAIVLDTELLNSLKYVDTITVDESIAISHPEGIASILYNNVTPVILKNENISIEDEPIIVPIAFNEPIELETIVLSTTEGAGSINKVSFAITYFDEFFNRNTTKEYVVDGDANSDQLVLKLPDIVEVINVELKVLSVVDNVDFASISQICFNKQVIDTNPAALSGSINNLNITVDDSLAQITFDAVEHVDGYNIFMGREPGLYDEVIFVNEPYLLLEDLENFSYYYFAVQSTYQDWTGQISKEVQVVPCPEERFGETESIVTTSGDRSVTIEWESLDMASHYKVLVKRRNQSDDEYREVAYNVEGTSFTIEKLSNDVPYTFAIQACNEILDSIVSKEVLGTPISDGYEIPEIPSLDRIDNKLISNVSYIDDVNIHEDYTDLFFMENLTDGSYHSYWTGSFEYDATPGFNFEFNQPVDMDYVMWVPRLDGDWISYLDNYFINVTTVQVDGTISSKQSVEVDALKLLEDEFGEPYILLSFDKIVDIISIEIGMYPNDLLDNEQVVSLSEIAFYHSNTFSEQIDDLFIDSARTDVVGGTGSSEVSNLEASINDVNRFVKDRDILNTELELALLYMNNKPSPGVIANNLVSMNDVTSGFVNYSPLGVLGQNGSELIVYATIPNGSNLSIIATVNGSASSNYITKEYALVDGKNIINITDFSTGGSLYYSYSGADGAVIHVYQETNNSYNQEIITVPYLDLYDMYNLNEDQIKDKITDFVNEIKSVYTSFIDDEGNSLLANTVYDSADISLRNIMLTLPISQIYDVNYSVNGHVEKLYNAILAWQELTEVLNGASGLIDIKTGRESRQYIRYISSSDDIQSYGNVIGVSYNYASNLISGYSSATSSIPNLYGFNVSSCLGVALDSIGNVNLTNQLYGYYAITHDGHESVINNSYINWPSVYNYLYGDEKLTDSIALAMHWQLQQAYAGEVAYDFFGEFNRILNSGIFDNYSFNDSLVLAYSKAANVDLTDFFSDWNINLSSSGINAMNDLNLLNETNKVQYFDGTIRSYRLSGGNGLSGNYSNYSLVSNVDVFNETGRVWIWVAYAYDYDDILGFEVYRDGEFLMFIPDISFTDYIPLSEIENHSYSLNMVDFTGKVHYIDQTVDVTVEDFE